MEGNGRYRFKRFSIVGSSARADGRLTCFCVTKSLAPGSADGRFGRCGGDRVVVKAGPDTRSNLCGRGGAVAAADPDVGMIRCCGADSDVGRNRIEGCGIVVVVAADRFTA